jgi:hypothetical protein
VDETVLGQLEAQRHVGGACPADAEYGKAGFEAARAEDRHARAGTGDRPQRDGDCTSPRCGVAVTQTPRPFRHRSRIWAGKRIFEKGQGGVEIQGRKSLQEARPARYRARLNYL